MLNITRSNKVEHPAKYSSNLLPIFTRILRAYNVRTVLDCFAGTGKIHELPFNTIGIELEPEWASMHKRTAIGDATTLPFRNGSFDAICTSPTYGNRMADCHVARDSSRRNTYTHRLGRKLAENNSGKMQWGEAYRVLHTKVWAECYRILRVGGCLVLNFKNHIRRGAEVDVFGWQVSSLYRQGFTLRAVEQVETPGNRFGENSKLRLPFEYVATLEK